MQESGRQRLSRRTEEGVLVLAFTEPLLEAAAVEEALAAVAETECRKVVLDCRAVHSLVSGSLYPGHEPFKPLVALLRRLEGDGGRLVLCNLDAGIEEVLRITRLNTLFEIQPDLHQALSALGAAGGRPPPQ